MVGTIRCNNAETFTRLTGCKPLTAQTLELIEHGVKHTSEVITMKGTLTLRRRAVTRVLNVEFR